MGDNLLVRLPVFAHQIFISNAPNVTFHIFGKSLEHSTFVRNRANGSIYAFGLNNYSQLGMSKKSGDTVFSPQLTSFENVKSITGEIANLK